MPLNPTNRDRHMCRVVVFSQRAAQTGVPIPQSEKSKSKIKRWGKKKNRRRLLNAFEIIVIPILFVGCAPRNILKKKKEEKKNSDNRSFSQNISALSFYTLTAVCLAVWIISQTAYSDRLLGWRDKLSGSSSL